MVYNFQLSTFLHCNVSTKERDFKYYFHNFKRLGLLFNLSGGITQAYGETVINRNFFNLKLNSHFHSSQFSLNGKAFQSGVNAILCESKLKRSF